MRARLALAAAALAMVGASCSAAVDVAVTADPTPTPVDEPMPAEEMTAADVEADVPPPVLAPTSAPDPAANQCDEAYAELIRREEAGTFSETEFEELDDEAALAPIELPAIDTAVAPPGSRPEFAEFPEAPVVADATDDEVLHTVERCFETGLLLEEELDEDD